MDLDQYNAQVDEKKQVYFQNKLIDRMNSITDYNILLNDKRSEYLYLSKTSIIVSLFLTGLLFIVKSFTN